VCAILNIISIFVIQAGIPSCLPTDSVKALKAQELKAVN